MTEERKTIDIPKKRLITRSERSEGSMFIVEEEWVDDPSEILTVERKGA
jgi:hypothetical protein